MITLKKKDFESIVSYARSELPNEACGLIAGKIADDDSREVLKVYFLKNLDASNEHFSMDPKEQVQAIKDMRAHGLVPIGNWHSHPESPSRPSEEDKRLAFDPKASYMILSLMEETPVLNSFRIKNKVSDKDTLVLVD